MIFIGLEAGVEVKMKQIWLNGWKKLIIIDNVSTASLVASRKKESGLALGNAIGSNIFNILFILGMSAVLSPIPAAAETMIDVVLMSGVAVLMLVFAGSKKGFSKLEGILCVALYVMYTAYLFIR